MAEQDDDGLLAIEVDANEYAQTVAADSPIVSRTYQSEADFQAVKAAYTAKHDYGNTLADLLTALPELDREENGHRESANAQNGHVRRLGKKEGQLLGYAVGELYYDRQYKSIVDLCQRIGHCYEIDARLDAGLTKWSARCNQKMAASAKTNSDAAIGDGRRKI